MNKGGKDRQNVKIVFFMPSRIAYWKSESFEGSLW